MATPPDRGDDRGQRGHLVGNLIEGFLEVDLGFTALEHVEARWERWLVALDRVGDLDERLRQPWAARQEPDLERDYRRRTDSIWYWLMKAAIAVERRKPLFPPWCLAVVPDGRSSWPPSGATRAISTLCPTR